MAEVRITVHGQGYVLRCAEGEQERVHKLAAYFNSHVERLAEELGHVAESRLLILAGLNICDELFADKDLANGQDTSHDNALAENLDSLAKRIERCAEQLRSPESPSGEDA